jgi:hypothetical protein
MARARKLMTRETQWHKPLRLEYNELYCMEFYSNSLSLNGTSSSVPKRMSRDLGEVPFPTVRVCRDSEWAEFLLLPNTLPLWGQHTNHQAEGLSTEFQYHVVVESNFAGLGLCRPPNVTCNSVTTNPRRRLPSARRHVCSMIPSNDCVE